METAGVTAAMLATIVALTKVVEWLIKRYSTTPSKPPSKISLYPEQTRQLREIHEKMIGLDKDIVEMKKDNDTIAEAMKKIADCMQKVSETNEKVATIVDKIDRRQEIDAEVRKHAIAVGE